jgi:hypothetical protein
MVNPLLAAFVVFGIPLLGMLAAALTGHAALALPPDSLAVVLAAAAGLLLGLLAVYAVDRILRSVYPTSLV